MADQINYSNPSPNWSAAGVEPAPEFKASGYVAGYKPPAGFFNWFWTLVSKCITELQNKLQAYAAQNEADKSTISGTITAHKNDKENPHGVTAAQAGAASTGDLAAHTGNKNNPHGVTAAQAGALSATGVVPVANGGTGTSSIPYNSIVFRSSASAGLVGSTRSSAGVFGWNADGLTTQYAIPLNIAYGGTGNANGLPATNLLAGTFPTNEVYANNTNNTAARIRNSAVFLTNFTTLASTNSLQFVRQ